MLKSGPRKGQWVLHNGQIGLITQLAGNAAEFQPCDPVTGDNAEPPVTDPPTVYPYTVAIEDLADAYWEDLPAERMARTGITEHPAYPRRAGG